MLTFTEAQLMAWVTPVFWPFLRVLGLFTAAPALSARALPVRSRIALAFFIALCAQPALVDQPTVSLNATEALLVAVQQVTVGVALGLAARIVFSAFELAGELIGLQMGLNFAGFFDPATGAQSSAVGRLFGNLTLLLFVVLNGHLLLVHTIVHSFAVFPIGHDPLHVATRLKLHELGAVVFYHGLLLSLPLMGMLLLVNATLGILSRVAPQMNAFAIGFPITLSVGLLGILGTLPLLEAPLVKLLTELTALFTS